MPRAPRVQVNQTIVVRGAAAGALIGAIDVIDVIAGGFAPGLGVVGGIGAVLTLAALGAAAGTMVGAVVALLKGLERFGVRWPARRQAAVVTTIALTIVTSGLLVGLRMVVPIAPIIAVLGTVLAGLVLLALLWRRPTIAAWIAWPLLFVWADVLGARLLYSFSRAGVATIAHAASMIVICVIGAIALSPLIRRRVSNRDVVIALLAAAAVLVSARPLLTKTSHTFRLALYERTSFGFRVLASLPGPGLDRGVLTRDCAPPGRRDVAVPAGLERPMRGVVVIMVDALRADRVGAKTPNLSALDGWRFVNGFSPAPSTKHAVRATLIGAVRADTSDRREDESSIGTRLAAAGIPSHAIASHATVAGLLTGLDTVELIEPTAKANRESLSSPKTAERARAALIKLRTGDRFFLFVHFYDPHAHYVENPLFDGGMSLAARYDAEVAYTDHFIGRLLADVGDPDDVAVLVFGDHGEELWDHRYRWHRTRVYDESVRVPIILRVPGEDRPGDVEGLVSIADIAPTILELYGIDHQIAGPSLLTSARARRQRDDRALFLFSDIEPTYAVVRGDDKVIANLGTGILEHYNLAADPGEQHNLADRPRPPFDELRCLLGQRLTTGIGAP